MANRTQCGIGRRAILVLALRERFSESKARNGNDFLAVARFAPQAVLLQRLRRKGCGHLKLNIP